MLMWHHAPWLIDHGATLYFHHNPGWEEDTARARAVFPLIKDHVLLRAAAALHEVDAVMASALTPDVVDSILANVPDEWLGDRVTLGAAEMRAAYRRYLLARLEAPRAFVAEAARVR